MMPNYHEPTIGEAVETFSEHDKNTMYYILGSILQDEVKIYEDYEKLLSKMPKPNDYVVNALVFAAARDKSFPTKRLNSDMEAWAGYIYRSYEPCLFLVKE